MGISERTAWHKTLEKNPVVCCDKKLETDFCPYCGNSLKNVEQLQVYRLSRTSIKFPHQFYVYLHNDDNYDIDKMLKKLDITKDDEIYDDIRGCAYEVKLEYEITARDGKVNLISVDGRTLTKGK